MNAQERKKYRRSEILLWEEDENNEIPFTMQELEMQTKTELIRKMREETREKEIKNDQRKGLLIPKDQVILYSDAIKTELLLIFQELEASAPLLIDRQEIEIDEFLKSKVDEYKTRLATTMQEKANLHLAFQERGNKLGAIK